MLPSTGYFKTINCPFYESGSCDRPYCHFKHARREDAGGSAALGRVAETQAGGQEHGSKGSPGSTPNPEMLQQLVSEAVKQVLADREVTATEGFSETIVSKVVEGLKPTFTSSNSPSMDAASNAIGKHINIPTPITKPVPFVYNPTPISELKKRHIPVFFYMPTRETKLAVKRRPSPDQPKAWNSIINESSSSKIMEVTYKPTAITNTIEQDSTESYIPTLKSDSSSNSYEDSNSNENDYVPKVKEAYYPKSKKRREEYVPKKIKAPLKNVQCMDDSEFDSYESQYSIFDKILSASSSATDALINKESEEYNLDIEGKFSDDEPMPDPVEDSSSKTTRESTAASDATDKDNVTESEKHENGIDNEKYITHNTDLSDNIENNENVKQKDKHDTKDERSADISKSSHKKQIKESSKEGDDRKRRRSNSKSRDKDDKEHRSSSRSGSSKEKHKHKSSSKDKHHSSSHSDSKSRSKHSHSSKDSSHRHKEHSSSRKDKESSKKDDKKNHHRSDRHDKNKSKSSSEDKSRRHTSGNSSKEHHSRKSDSRKKCSSEKSLSDNEERSASPVESMHSFEDAVMLSSDSEHDVEEECLKIFQEYQVTDQPKVTSVKESAKPEIEEVEEPGRKRIAHPSAATSVTRTPGPSQPPKKLPNPQQRMYERWRLMREAAAEKAAEKAGAIAKYQITAISASPSANNTQEAITEPSVPVNNNEPHVNGRSIEPQLNGRVRIAHVPYAMSLALKKKKAEETSAKTAENKSTVESRTSAQTNKGARVAHVPQVVPQLVRPEPLQVTTQKFPLNVRQYYVNMMHDICVQIYTNGEDAAQRALREEHACHERCKALAVYKNSCMLAAHRLRKEVDQSKLGDGSVPSASGMVSHEAVLAGKSKGSWSVMKTKKATMTFKGSALYAMLVKWIMTEQQLRDNGFPRPHPEGPKGRAKIYVINSRNQNQLSKVPNERICCRCGQPYMVDKTGMPVQQQNCIFHWGRKFTIRGEGKYSCCQQYGSATGCCDAKNHVWNYTDYENLRGYVQTFPKDVPVEEQGVYALDCEMCYTTQGLELTRVTVINEDCNVIYETLVKPQNTIIDYNTRFSGITEDDMKDVTTSLLDVQATLLTMFSEKTILVGHSLESDFKALRLVHDTVVDTSVMFPHKNGYPQKRALRNLCSEYLRKIIQNDVGGHDSKEDAVSCMELILWKVKEEAKLQ